MPMHPVGLRDTHPELLMHRSLRLLSAHCFYRRLLQGQASHAIESAFIRQCEEGHSVYCDADTHGD